MPLIKRQEPIETKPLTARIPTDLLKQLNDYAEYTNVPRDEIVATAIRHAIATDKNFLDEHTRQKGDRTVTHTKTKPKAEAKAAGD